MFTVGAGGYVWLTGGAWTPLLNSLKNLAYARLSNYDLIVIRLFLLMGQFATHGGLSRSLFRFVSAFMGHWRGGVAMASVGACAGFGAICGSSLQYRAGIITQFLPADLLCNAVASVHQLHYKTFCFAQFSRFRFCKQHLPINGPDLFQLYIL